MGWVITAVVWEVSLLCPMVTLIEKQINVSRMMA